MNELERLRALPPKRCGLCGCSISILNDIGFCGICIGKNRKAGLV